MFESVEVTTLHNKDGSIEPISFILNDKKYSCGEILNVTENKFAGNPMHVFKMKSGKQEYELRFELNTGKWFIKY
jgi:hypothetical protein